MESEVLIDFDELCYLFPEDTNADQLGPLRSDLRTFGLPVPSVGCLDEESESFIAKESISEDAIAQLGLLQLVTWAPFGFDSDEARGLRSLISNICVDNGYFPGNAYQVARDRLLRYGQDCLPDRARLFNISMGYSKCPSPLVLANNEIIFEVSTKALLKLFSTGLIEVSYAISEHRARASFTRLLSRTHSIPRYLKTQSPAEFPLYWPGSRNHAMLAYELVGIQLEFLMAHEFAHVHYDHHAELRQLISDEKRNGKYSVDDFRRIELEADMFAVDCLLRCKDEFYLRHLGDAISSLFAFFDLYSSIMGTSVQNTKHPSPQNRWAFLARMFDLKSHSTKIQESAFEVSKRLATAI